MAELCDQLSRSTTKAKKALHGADPNAGYVTLRLHPSFCLCQLARVCTSGMCKVFRTHRRKNIHHFDKQLCASAEHCLILAGMNLPSMPASSGANVKALRLMIPSSPSMSGAMSPPSAPGLRCLMIWLNQILCLTAILPRQPAISQMAFPRTLSMKTVSHHIMQEHHLLSAACLSPMYMPIRKPTSTLLAQLLRPPPDQR